MNNSPLIVCSLAAAIAALVLSSCGNNLKIVVVPGFNKPAPAVNKGDVVTWTGLDGKPMKVQFTVFSPCKEGLGWIDTCSVNTASGKFIYSCESNQCDDPELPVGGVYGPPGFPTRPKANPSTFTSYVGVYCDPQTHVAAVQAQTAAKGQTFQWEGIGSPAPALWWVTVSATTCTSGSTEFGTRNNDPLTCTVAQTATTQNNYAVHVDGCTTPDSTTGVLTIQ